MSKVYLSEPYFYLSWTIGHRFWCTLRRRRRRENNKIIEEGIKTLRREIIKLWRRE